jgi:hypothetical protein
VASPAENAAFGSNLDDPLELVWPHWPVAEIQRQYENHFLLHNSTSKSQTKTPPSWIKVDWRWMLVGALWWICVYVGWFGVLLGGLGLALLLSVIGEMTRNHLLRDRSASFCFGAMAAPCVVLFASIFPLILKNFI